MTDFQQSREKSLKVIRDTDQKKLNVIFSCSHLFCKNYTTHNFCTEISAKFKHLFPLINIAIISMYS